MRAGHPLVAEHLKQRWGVISLEAAKFEPGRGQLRDGGWPSTTFRGLHRRKGVRLAGPGRVADRGGWRSGLLAQGLEAQQGAGHLHECEVWGDPQQQAGIWAAHNPYDLAPRLRGIRLFVSVGNGQLGPLDGPANQRAGTADRAEPVSPERRLRGVAASARHPRHVRRLWPRDPRLALLAAGSCIGLYRYCWPPYRFPLGSGCTTSTRRGFRSRARSPIARLRGNPDRDREDRRYDEVEPAVRNPILATREVRFAPSPILPVRC